MRSRAWIERILVDQEPLGELPDVRDVVSLEVTELGRKRVAALKLVGAAIQSAKLFQQFAVLIQAGADVTRSITDQVVDHSRLELSRQGLLAERPDLA